MSARKPRNRQEQKERREELISKYMSEYQAMLLIPSEDPEKWLTRGDAYERSLKLIAEREIFKLMKAKEVGQSGLRH